MEIELIEVADLHLDPANVRRHDGKNLDAIAASLARFGQQKPIVVSPAGVVLAGNGTLSAAKRLGWSSIRAVTTSLENAEATAYAIADNRTAELAEWDDDALAQQLSALQIEDAALLEAVGFTDDELTALVNDSIGLEPEPPEEVAPVDPEHDGAGDEWYTPPHIVAAVRDALGGEISLDPCAALGSPVEASVQYHQALGDDGLINSWDYPAIYCNPPYSNVGPWFARGVEAAASGSRVIFLVPLRPETAHWRDHIWPNNVRVLVPSGRIRFVGKDGVVHGSGMLATGFVCMGPGVEEMAHALRESLGDGWPLQSIKGALEGGN